MITSLSVPAYAQNYGPQPCTFCLCFNEPGAPACGTGPTGNECNCLRRSSGECVCVQPDADGGFCGPGDTCDPGYACVCMFDTAATRCVALCETVP
jgi:hypothetical protein